MLRVWVAGLGCGVKMRCWAAGVFRAGWGEAAADAIDNIMDWFQAL